MTMTTNVMIIVVVVIFIIVIIIIRIIRYYLGTWVVAAVPHLANKKHPTC